MDDLAHKFKDGEFEASEEVREEEQEPQERSAVAVVISGIGLGVSVIQSILNGLGSVDRKIVISFANATPHPLSAVNVYFQSGTSDMGLAPSIPVQHTLGFGARKTSGPVARGSVGVLTYYIQATNQTAAIMWSVPFDYNLYSNWWNFEVRPGRVLASNDLYSSLYYTNAAIRGDSNSVRRTTGGWTFEGSMGHSGTPLLNVTLMR